MEQTILKTIWGQYTEWYWFESNAPDNPMARNGFTGSSPVLGTKEKKLKFLF